MVPTGVLEPGMGLGWGLPAWVIGPMAYRWGYFAFANPYLVGPPPSGPARSGFPDYSRPVRQPGGAADGGDAQRGDRGASGRRARRSGARITPKP